MGVTYGELTNTPIGPFSFVAGDQGLIKAAFLSLSVFKSSLDEAHKRPSLKGLVITGTLLAEMNAYLFGIQKSFTVDIDWRLIQGFQREVLMLVSEIPYGEIMTYGGVAKKLGKPGSARAVGNALGNNPIPIVIPCHRVIGSDEKIRGYVGGLDKKKFLLMLEGHTIDAGRVFSE